MLPAGRQERTAPFLGTLAPVLTKEVGEQKGTKTITGNFLSTKIIASGRLKAPANDSKRLRIGLVA